MCYRKIAFHPLTSNMNNIIIIKFHALQLIPIILLSWSKRTHFEFRKFLINTSENEKGGSVNSMKKCKITTLYPRLSAWEIKTNESKWMEKKKKREKIHWETELESKNNDQPSVVARTCHIVAANWVDLFFSRWEVQNESHYAPSPSCPHFS